MSSPLRVAETNRERVELYEDEVRIRRTATLQRTGDTIIKLSEIDNIKFRKPSLTRFMCGYLYFDQENSSRSKLSIYTYLAPFLSHENTVVLQGLGDHSDFKALKEKAQELINSSDDGQNRDTALETLRQRLAEGEISEDEFEKKKEMLEK